MKIAIIGASGFLGTKLMNFLSKENEVIGTYSGNKKNRLSYLDALNKKDLKNFITENKPDFVVDTIALTSSLVCENNPQLAEQLNYETAKNISEVCIEKNIPMIFISSSYLFDGEKGNYSETGETVPQNQYARTKIMAEKELSKNPKAIIIRVDIMYGYNGKNEKNGVFDMILSEKPIQLREPNQLRQPLFVDDNPCAASIAVASDIDSPESTFSQETQHFIAA